MDVFLVVLVSGKASVIASGTVRVLKGEGGGEVWFVALDVCKALGLTDARKSVGLLDEDERNTVPVTDSLGREQHTFIINESGLYSLSFWMMMKNLPVQ
ncbi:prophage antirepressor [Oleidesulfovibrio alaskensis G20]|jgi:prophage antirepressor-like protein|uniref:Prophage antirepressor n=1 Tax=Oleidesulfovibrio alaskensis (strain ATCC BAA-1058 / DSM 17464 / G20) TaxID=207559 RepID=Q310W7_OLEA2|nr:Bro-N domain-containing protein [Oleidesulfovibrio alaskensis]ABB38529.2 prophage antirepressor [Oleidesulfovibrio alaskensis G20]